MNSPRILVVYYSRSGTTRKLAAALRSELHCDMERISDRAPRVGPLGYLRSVVDELFSRRADIRPMQRDVRDYDLVIVGGPVWNGGIATPVRAFLEQYRSRLPRLAFFCTYARSGSAQALREIAEYSGQSPLVTLDVRRADMASLAVLLKVRTFAATVGTLAPPPRNARAPAQLALALPVSGA